MVSNRVLNSFLWFTILLQLLTHAASTVHQSSSRASSDNGGAPWQKSGDSRSIIEESTYEDLPPTIFSPNGRLHSIERVVRASKIPNNPRSNLLLALKCKEGLVVLTTLTTSPFLNTTVNSNLWLVEDNQTATTSTSPILDLGPASGLLVATAGNTVDGQVLRQKIQAYAEYNLEQEKDTIEAYVLARNIADHLQANTQTVGGRDGRMLASSAVICGNRQLWRIDPTGQFWNCHAVAMGRAEEQAERQLYEMLRQKQQSDKEDDLGDFLETLTADEALHLACQCMEELLHPKQSSGGSSNNVIHWQSVTLDFTANRYKPKRIIQRGAFLPPHKDTKTDKS